MDISVQKEAEVVREMEVMEDTRIMPSKTTELISYAATEADGAFTMSTLVCTAFYIHTIALSFILAWNS